ncbi:MAG: type III-A CRISPR-associated RAMP protein Csm5 [Spirochaetota bacterium]
MKSYTVKIHIITPLIIHSGEFYSIFELLPTKDGKSIMLIDFNKAFNFMSQKEREQFFSIMDTLVADIKKDKEKLLRARSILQNVALQNLDVIIQRVQAHPQFIQGVDSNPYAIIYKIFKDELSMKPYIPGSTLKGALRTALLESLRKKNNMYPNVKLFKNNKPKNFQSTDFEMQIMKKDTNAIFDIGLDPFRFMKVSDLMFKNQTVLLDTVRIIGKGKQQKGIPIYTEMSASHYINKDECIAEGEITIDEDGLKKFVNNYKLGDFLNIEFIMKSLMDFNLEILNNKKHPIDPKVKENITTVCNSNELIPLRLGRFTQIESKTFKIKQKKAIPPEVNLYGGVSRSLIRGEIPAGWCGLKIQN